MKSNFVSVKLVVLCTTLCVVTRVVIWQISVEFAGELHDFLTTDVIRWFPDLKSDVKVGGEVFGA